MGVRLHEYDIDLTDYAVGNVIQYLADHRFARWVSQQVRSPALAKYLEDRGNPAADAEQVRRLLSDAEMSELVSAFEDGPPGGPWTWVPYPELHRRYVQTVKEVQAELARPVGEEWSADCVGYARRLEVEDLSLDDGLRIVCEWIRRLRDLQLAMGAERYVPPADRQKDHPPTPPPEENAATDPRYRGLSAKEIHDIGRMREAIKSHADRTTAKSRALIRAARISKQRGGRALRWLEKQGEYGGFLKSTNASGSRPPPS